MDEVARSSRVSSTQFLPTLSRTTRAIGFTFGGFVAGEGWFTIKRQGVSFKRDGTPRLRFVFGVTVASRDRPMLEALQSFLGCGKIWDKPAQRSGWQPGSSFEVVSTRLHRQRVIPFAEAFLLQCHKRQQFEAWRGALFDYEERRPSQYGRGRSQCSVPGCDKPVRGRMLCRSHYYRATGY